MLSPASGKRGRNTAGGWRCPFLHCHACLAEAWRARCCQHPDLVRQQLLQRPALVMQLTSPCTQFLPCTMVSSSQHLAAFPSNPLGKFDARMLQAGYHLCVAFPFSGIPEDRCAVSSTREASQWLCSHPVIHSCDRPTELWISVLGWGGALLLPCSCSSRWIRVFSAAIAYCHKLVALKQQKCILSNFGSSEVKNQGIVRLGCLWRLCERNHPLFLS